MFTCIACTKQVAEEEEEDEYGGGGGRGSGSKKAVKNLTTQIKDMALKLSGGKQCRPCVGSGTYTQGDPFDMISEGIPCPFGGRGSAASTPAWDFPSAAGRHPHVARTESRFAADRTPSGLSVSASDIAVLDEEDEPKEWMAQVEPGVNISFVTLPNGGNDLKRIRFSRDMFDKWQAQRWWAENYDRIKELYNIQRFNRQALNTPSRSEDKMWESSYSRLESARGSPMVPWGGTGDWPPRPPGQPRHLGTKGNVSPEPSDNRAPSLYGAAGANSEAAAHPDASRMTSSSRDEASVSYSNASEVEAEWIEEDEPGVYITIRQLVDGTRELRRVRFSREKFGETRAKLWWEENRERIQATYLY
ncbi:hypothetical protein MLD38_027831 [Melastoma candidum]|uniref:Uncharacterized protein n=1 Tax=Melastoma candidum TaxID=119954 RepID=A0ACB9P5R5_9MYRT|nr:hypothetical protein MLD38_027831 [Melastoma candidum]